MATLTLRGINVWDGLRGAAVESTVTMEDGHVTALGAAGGADFDFSGCTVIPGLIDGHAHLCFNAGTDWRAVYDSDTAGRMLLRMAWAGRSMLEAGITTVRDLGAPTTLAVEIRDAFRSGLVPGPDLLVSGAPITTTGGHCHFMGGEADGELEIRKAVRNRVKAGVDCIKIMATGGNMTRGTNTLAAQFTVDELGACVDEAHRLRKKVAAHCHGTPGIVNAVAAGVDFLEHCSFNGPAGIDYDPESMVEAARKGIVVSPTVSVGYRRWPDDGLRRRRGEVLQNIFAANVPVLMSTDCGIPGVPHAALAGGMDVLRDLAGLSPVDTLKLATSRAAELLGLTGRGVIAEGQRADLLVLDGNPLAELSALERVRAVFKAGQLVYERGRT